MAREPIYAAIDVGTSKVFSIVARLGPEGELKPLGTGSAPALGVRQGTIDDLSEVKDSVRDSLDECLRYVGRNPVSEYYAVVNGDHLVSENSRELLDDGGELLTVTEQHLRTLIGGSSGILQQQVDSRSEQVLHIIPMRYRLDGMTGVRNPTGLHTNELQVEAHVVRGKSVPLGNMVRALQTTKMRVEGLVSHPLASGEGILTADEREMGVTVIDIGAGTIKIACYREGTPCFSSVIPVGGNQLTRDLAVSLRAPFQMAEDMKIEHGHVLPEQVPSADEIILPATQVHAKRIVRRQEMCEPLYLRSLQMLKLIQEELSHADIETSLAGGVVLTGGGSKMPGFAEMTARGLRTQVRIGVPLWYAGLPESLRQPEYAAALGVLQWAVKHRNQPDRGRVRGEGDRNWSPGSLLRRPFSRSGAGRKERQR
jgi:cell division protein FtsA